MDNNCITCNTPKECLAGHSAHPNNWYCPNCEAKEGKSNSCPVKCGDLLLGLSSLSCDGTRTWFDFPRYRVVAIHYKEELFFVEWLNEEGEIANKHYYTFFDFDSSQYKLYKDRRYLI